MKHLLMNLIAENCIFYYTYSHNQIAQSRTFLTQLKENIYSNCNCKIGLWQKKQWNV